jgi:hypothetical protein
LHEAGTRKSAFLTRWPRAAVTRAELLRLLHAEANRVSDTAARIREAVETATDPTALKPK